MISFPNLDISKQEIDDSKAVESQLTKRIGDVFEVNYSVRPPVRVSGSTQKGTALPRSFFGTDIDIAVQGDSSLVEKIAYPNEVFEGCPLFSMDFFQRFTNEFPEVYFAGHRLSGVYDRWPFDFAIADSDKDQWKWDYNNSKFLDFSEDQMDSAKKLKFFLKTFNLAGSEVNGVVGPALELMVYHHKSLDEILRKVGKLSRIPDSFSDYFGTVLFPEEYKAIFPEMGDYIHKGLVDSFKFTTPNTYNRLIDCAQRTPNSIQDFISNHNPSFNYSRNIPTTHYKMLAHLLGTELKEQPFFHVDILNEANGMGVYASADKHQQKILQKIIDSVEAISYNQDLAYSDLPKSMQADLSNKNLRDPERLTYFVGRPSLPLDEQKVYVPFDFLLREDCKDLIQITEDGQNKSK